MAPLQRLHSQLWPSPKRHPPNAIPSGGGGSRRPVLHTTLLSCTLTFFLFSKRFLRHSMPCCKGTPPRGGWTRADATWQGRRAAQRGALGGQEGMRQLLPPLPLCLFHRCHHEGRCSHWAAWGAAGTWRRQRAAGLSRRRLRRASAHEGCVAAGPGGNRRPRRGFQGRQRRGQSAAAAAAPVTRLPHPPPAVPHCSDYRGVWRGRDHSRQQGAVPLPG